MLGLPALGSCLSGSPIAEPRYEATIRRTSYGVAHIAANDLGSAGFGQGYAFAEDHACILADQIVKVRSERSRFFGPDKHPGDGLHLNSDFAYQHLGILQRAEAAWEQQTADVKAIIEGYAAGYNQYLSETGAENVPGSCQGAAWLRPITATELVAYYIDLGTLAGSWQMIQYMATSQPPGSARALPAPGLAALTNPRTSGFGSNGWALGKERTESGHGMVVSNPHFPWEGELKLWESHITVPGVLDIYGVGLMGVPGSLIGFNEHVAWAHTFSSGQRFTIYALTLAEGEPTKYVYDGETRAMTGQEYTVEVLQPDGSLAAVKRTLWSSHWGPIIGLDPFVWDKTTAMTFRDANIDNVRLIEQFSGMNRATSLAEFKKVYEDVGGVPWVNTMAADREGHAWYIDASATPRLSQAAIDGWLQSIEDGDFIPSAVYAQAGVVVLDGSDPENEWTDAPGARSPGLVPYAELPQIDRADFVFNANDSYWLANPAAPLEGFSPMHGLERVPQSPRTRMNVTLLTEQGEGTAAGADGKFTVEELQAAIMGNRSMTADLLRDAVVARCDGAGEQTVKLGVGEPEQTVAIAAACAALAGWDGRFDPDSVGAIVWRELLGNYANEALEDFGLLFAKAFDPDDPIATPYGLKDGPEEGDDPLLQALGKAVLRLGQARLGVDAPLRAAQFAYRGDEKIAVHGGQNRDGTTNVVNYGSLKSTVAPGTGIGEIVSANTELSVDGYVVNYGTSFVMAVELTDAGPKGFGFLSYSQSDDPATGHVSDQTKRLFAKKQWRPLLYSEADIAADPKLRVYPVAGGEQPADAE